MACRPQLGSPVGVVDVQVALFLVMTLYMFWKAPTVEGVLDGSMDPTGVVLKPRVVEVSYGISINTPQKRNPSSSHTAQVMCCDSDT